MAGILNSKQRIMDTIITTEGRRQVAEGDLRFHFVSFTDRHTFYEASGSLNVAASAANRIYFEATNRPQDQIIIETDDVGQMLPFKGGDVEIFGNKILSSLSGSQKRLNITTGSQTLSYATKLLRNCATNFDEQQLIGTRDIFSENSSFNIVPDNLKFTLTDNFPYDANSITQASIDNVESLFQDMRLSHLPNYRFMPPINRKTPGEQSAMPLGEWKKLNQSSVLTFQDLMGFLSGKESISVNFMDTSMSNNIVCQMFEIKPNNVEKLTIIDFGEFPDADPVSKGKHVFFIGKIYTDGHDNLTFVNMFTIIFD